MRTGLLLRLADLLEADAANPKGVKFDLKDWAKPSEGGRTFGDENEVVPVNCTTAACALGLAAISETFKAEGLTYVISAMGALVPKIKTDYGSLRGYEAGQELFGLVGSYYKPITDRYGNPAPMVHALFDPDNYEVKTGAEAELAVAKRIREVVATELGENSDAGTPKRRR